MLTSKGSALIFSCLLPETPPICNWKNVSQESPYLYNPILNTTAINILIHPVANLEIVIAAIPTCVVSGLASVIPSPTGMKSQAHWQLMAKSAGSAITGGILPAAINSPITVENICAATAPAPRIALRPGMEQIIPNPRRPGRLPPIGWINPARNCVSPEPLQIPMKSAANPMKGRIISRQVFTASLADCWNKLITLLIVSTGSKKLVQKAFWKTFLMLPCSLAHQLLPLEFLQAAPAASAA